MSHDIERRLGGWSGLSGDKKLKYGILIAFLAIDLILVVVVFLMPWLKYSSANKNVRKGNYEKAICQYNDLGDYKEAPQRLKAVQGISAIEEGKTAPGIAFIVEHGFAVEVAFDPGEGRMVQNIPGDTVRYQGNNAPSAQMPLPEAEKLGYQFEEWYLEELHYKPGKDKTVYLKLQALFTTVKYAIHYEGGVGMENPNPSEYDCESDAITLQAPTWDGYRFLGWTWEGQSAPVMSARIEAGSKGEKTFTAHWEGLTYEVTLDPNGGTVSPRVKTVTMGKPANLPTPSKKGYAFQGWSQGGLLIHNDSAWCVSENTGAKAMWKARSYTVTLDADGGTCSSKSVAVTYDAAYSLPTPVREGYDFQGWYSGTVRYSGGTWKTDSSVTLKAVWKGRQFTVTLDPNGGTVSSRTARAVMGESVSLPTPVLTGWKFLGWYTDKTGGELIASGSAWTTARDVTLYAHWEQVFYTLTVNPNGGVYSGNTPVSVTCGKTVTLVKPTWDANHEFKGWEVSGVGSISGNTFTAGEGNATVTAKWEDHTPTPPPDDPPEPPASSTDA